MPEHVLMSEIEIITDGGRRRRWTAAEKLRIVEETLEDHASISIVRGAIGNVHRKGLLAAAQRAEIEHRPVEPSQLQQACDERRCLPKRHPKEDFDR